MKNLRVIDLDISCNEPGIFFANLCYNYSQNLMKVHKVGYYIKSTKDVDWSIAGTDDGSSFFRTYR